MILTQSYIQTKNCYTVLNWAVTVGDEDEHRLFQLETAKKSNA